MFPLVSAISVTVPLAGVVGLFIGSFLNVVIYRTPLGLSVATPRSFCPTCDRQLQWWENIPVVSWLGLQGSCRTCHARISIRYPLVELITGVTFAITTWAFHGTLPAAAYCVLAASTIAVGLIQYGGQRAPVSVALIGTGLALAILVVGGAIQHSWATALGAMLGTFVALAAYGVARASDPECAAHRGRGPSILFLAGCWMGGLGLPAAAAGATVWLLAYATCTVGAWATARSAVSAGSTPLLVGRNLNPLLRTPLVTAVVAAMVTSLTVGT